VPKVSHGHHAGFEPQFTHTKFYKTKSVPNFGTLSYLLLNLAGHIAQNWNTVRSSLICMYVKLKELEEIYGQSKITVASLVLSNEA
jgi:hypothetical protein